MHRQTAVVFGAGKMACGLLGQLLAQSGYDTQFVARRTEVIDAINHQQGYSLVVAGERARRVAVRRCSALSIRDPQRVAEVMAGADVVFTAVGVDNLAAISPVIAAGLAQRGQQAAARPLNVIACENLPGAGAYLRHQVVSAAPSSTAMTVERGGGFSAALTRRIMTGGAVQNGELTFTVDADYDLVIDSDGLKGQLPEVWGATFTSEFAVAVARKLFTINCAQAVATYLGYREGCRYVHEAATHPRVAPAVRGAVAEARAALAAEFPHHAADTERDAAEALARIANGRLADPISRVARAPRRKLSPRERLVGPARLAARHGLPTDYLCLGIAAALAYDDPQDPQAVAMQQTVQAEGLERLLTEDCGLLPYEDLARAVKHQWLGLVAPMSRTPPARGRLLAWDAGLLRNLGHALALRIGEHEGPSASQPSLLPVGMGQRGLSGLALRVISDLGR